MKVKKHIASFIRFTIGVFITCVSLSVLAGYVLHNFNMMSWGGDQFMAIPTAILFLLIGIQKIIDGLIEK